MPDMRKMMRAISLSVITLTLALLAGCASNGSTPKDQDVPEQQLYQQAQQALDQGRYSAAVNYLEALDSRYPFGDKTPYGAFAIVQENSWRKQ